MTVKEFILLILINVVSDLLTMAIKDLLPKTRGKGKHFKE